MPNPADSGRFRAEIEDIRSLATPLIDAHHLDPGGEQWTRLFAAIGPERRQRLESLMSEPLHRRVQEVTLRDTI